MPARSKPVTQADDRALTITRVFDAPRALVFKVWSAPEAPSITESPMPSTPGAGAGRPGPGAGPHAARASATTITNATLRATEPARIPALPARMIPLV